MAHGPPTSWSLNVQVQVDPHTARTTFEWWVNGVDGELLVATLGLVPAETPFHWLSEELEAALGTFDQEMANEHPFPPWRTVPPSALRAADA